MGPFVIHTEAAKKYYNEKDPLLNPGRDGKNSLWFGGGLSRLGLNEGDRVTFKDFKFVIDGKSLDNRQLVQLSYADSEKRVEHRAGLDFTLSDPKSLSICEHILHYKSDVIKNVRYAALVKLMSHIDQNYMYYRQAVDGVTTMHMSPSHGIMASFGHSLSRLNDPQAHTHIILFNMVFCTDGKVRGHSNEMIFKDQKYLTAVYHSEMAYSLARNGFVIEPQGRGLYEIGGIGRNVIDKFSKRSGQIDMAVQALRGKYPRACEAELRRMASLETRSAKDKNITPDQLNKSWSRQIYNDLKMTKDRLVKGLESAFDQHKSQMSVKTPTTALEFVTAAVRDLEQKEGTFREKTVLTHSMSLSLGHCLPADISQAFNKACEAGIIQQIYQKNFKNGLSEKIYSTPGIAKTVNKTFHSLHVDFRENEKELKPANNSIPKSELSHNRGVDDFKIEREFKIERDESCREYSRERDFGSSKQTEIEIGK